MESLSASVGRGLRSPGFKFFIIAGLIVLLLIPLLLVWAIIEDRSRNAEKAASEIAKEWGGKQTITGPFLIVPYTATRVVKQGDKSIEEIEERRAVFLPSQTDMKSSAAPKVLTRSIYDVTVYSGTVDVTGRFDAPNLAEVAADASTVRWQDAVLAVSISDVSGLKSASVVNIGDAAEAAFDPSFGLAGLSTQGIHARLGATPAIAGAAIKPFDFTFTLSLNGSSGLFFSPVARETTVTMDSPWPHPSFTGSFLPLERSVSAEGFTAKWQIPHLARSVPQAFSIASAGGDYREGPDQRLAPFDFGVNFYIPVDTYDLASRATKYAVMFLGTAFMVVFLMEIKGRRVHAAQYLLVGLAVLFFYVLLLALAEHIGFKAAYASAATATSAMLALYVAKAQANARKGWIMLGVLTGLYTMLYFILRMEDYALLVGALVGFVVLTAVMFATLRIDWSGRGDAVAA